LTAAECFGQEKRTHLVSSKGIDAEQTATEIYLQWVYIGGEGDSEVETFAEISRRRIKDLNLEEEAALRAQYTSDLLNAGKPKNYTGPVIVAGESLAVMVAGEMLAGSLLKTLSSASLKHSGETPWELGKSIFREDVKGDDFNVWANRRLPYGIPSSAFDQEGIPAQRVRLIEDNKLAAFIANQRYAQYLDMKPSGSFGCLEMSPGSHTEANLRSGSYIEIAEFSWFNPDPMTGNFACEIRLGYQVKDGQRVPFKGGMLVGNLLDALGNVYWSEEIGFYGNYLGPKTARFNLLQVAG
jgi:PmbA protein